MGHTSVLLIILINQMLQFFWRAVIGAIPWIEAEHEVRYNDYVIPFKISRKGASISFLTYTYASVFLQAVKRIWKEGERHVASYN